jgi:DNA polymerase family A/3'-5' exonuclease
MGAGKSTASRIEKRLLDPTANETVTVDRRDFLQKAAHCYVLMLDNQNTLPEWFQDTLCRLVTGESDSKRVLYTDDEDLIWSMKRVVLLNGINPPTDRGDVQDRTLPIELHRLRDDKRIAEDDFWLNFDLQHPKLLGAVFPALSGALKRRHTVRLDKKPRLADWGLYAAALYEDQGWGVSQFVEDWELVKDLQNQGTLDGSIVAQAIIAFMRDRDSVTQTASKLHAMIEEAVGEALNLKGDRDWPKTGRSLWKKIREVMPLLEARGIRASRSTVKRDNQPITLTTDLDGDPDGPERGPKVEGDNEGDNGKIEGDNAKVRGIIESVSPSSPPDTYANEGDNGLRGGYFGATLVSSTSDSKKEIGATSTQGESNPDLSPSSPSRPGSPVAVDLETTDLNPVEDSICILQYRTEGGQPRIIRAEEIPAFLEALEDCELILHNGAFDLAFLKHHFGWTPKRRVWDTMILSQLAYAGQKFTSDNKFMRHALQDCLKRELSVEISKEEQKSDWSGELTEEQIRYAKDDVRHLHLLRAALLDKMASSDEIVEMEMDLVPLMADMFLRGVRVDIEGWRELDSEIEAYKHNAERKLDRFGRVAMKRLDPEPSEEWAYDHDFNWGSPKQVKEVAAVLGIDLPDTSDESLALYVEHGFCRAMREHRKYSKLLSSYSADAIAKELWRDGVLRPKWWQAGTVTGRFACSDPGLQQMPREGGYREQIKPREGMKFVQADYSQIESRVAGVIAHEKKIIEAYQRGDDVHTLTAQAITGRKEITKNDRTLAKALNFGHTPLRG